MNTKKILRSIKTVAGAAARVPLLKKMLKPFYYPVKNALMSRYKHDFNKNALAALDVFDRSLTQNGIPYSLAFGSLLGAVREKGFIKHDIDIDVFMWADDYSPVINKILCSNGFKLVHSYTVDEGEYGREETYGYKGAYIDIFYLYPLDSKHYYCCDFLYRPGTTTSELSMKKYGSVLARQIELPIIKEFKRTEFESLNLPICVNAHEVLRYRYGEDYMIPNPSWGIRSYDTHIKELQDKDGIYRSY